MIRKWSKHIVVAVGKDKESTKYMETKKNMSMNVFCWCLWQRRIYAFAFYV